MGGSASEEFLAVSEAGEDTFVACTRCGYAANTEAVTTPAAASTDPHRHSELTVHDTPDTPTIESLVALANARQLGGRTDWRGEHTLKNVVVMLTRPGGGSEPLVVGVPGDREVDLKRLAAALAPATVRLFEAADFATHPGLVRGYIGPQVLAKLGVRYLVDPRVATGTAWLTGANEPGRHAVHVACGRDFLPDGTVEAAEVLAGDPCPACSSGELTMRRGIEVGHIFQLGRRYADCFGLDALGPDGQPIRITMGSYGVGVSRLVAVIAEQHHDARGLCWPSAVAPFAVQIVPTGTGDQGAAASRLAEELDASGLPVLLDDRTGLSAGVKFTDAELIGVPTTVVVGRRLADGYVELRDRASGARQDIPLDDVAARLVDAYRSAG
jgi:prolyl-tRNA synthetase